jgi:hypothetical protein
MVIILLIFWVFGNINAGLYFYYLYKRLDRLEALLTGKEDEE